jgi:hypothetical protein
MNSTQPAVCRTGNPADRFGNQQYVVENVIESAAICDGNRSTIAGKASRKNIYRFGSACFESVMTNGR